jgi:hypothetical protein
MSIRRMRSRQEQHVGNVTQKEGGTWEETEEEKLWETAFVVDNAEGRGTKCFF